MVKKKKAPAARKLYKHVRVQIDFVLELDTEVDSIPSWLSVDPLCYAEGAIRGTGVFERPPDIDLGISPGTRVSLTLSRGPKKSDKST